MQTKKSIINSAFLCIILSFSWNSLQKKDSTTVWSNASSAYQTVNLSLNPNNLDHALLERMIVYYTNQTRQRHHLGTCKTDSKLQEAAKDHSEEMGRLRYFSHESPVKINAGLIDRLQNAGLDLGNTAMGENIGVDYFLRIANVPFYTKFSNGKTLYIDAETEKPIEYQTYIEFAKDIVKNWMDSPHHRENILNKHFSRIGVGIAAGEYQGFEAIYVTQNFMGPIKPIDFPSNIP